MLHCGWINPSTVGLADGLGLFEGEFADQVIFSLRYDFAKTIFEDKIYFL